MRYIKGSDSRQMTMGIWSIEEEVAANSPARFIEVFVDSLDMAALEKTTICPAGSAQAVPVWLSERNPLFPEAGEGMRPEYRAVLPAEPVSTGPQHDFRFPKRQQKSAEEGISDFCPRLQRYEADGRENALPGWDNHSCGKWKEKSGQRRNCPQETGIREGAAAGGRKIFADIGRK